MQISTAVTEYLGNIEHLQFRTREGYKQRLEEFVAWSATQGIALEQINNNVVQRFIEHIRETHTSHYYQRPVVSTYTLANYTRNIRSFLHWCLAEEAYEQYVKASQVKKIKMVKVVKTVIETFTTEQLQALFSACEKEFEESLRVRDHAILAMLLDTGIRASELCTLTLTNVHLDTNDPYIKVLGKGQKEREVGLGTQSRLALLKYLKMFREAEVRLEIEQDIHAASVLKKREITAHERRHMTQRFREKTPVFVTRYHKRFTVNGLEKIIDRLSAWAHVKGVRCSPHTFRHTYAVNYLLNGGDLFKLSLLMGHEDVEVTQVYLRTVKSREARRGLSVLDIMGVK
jgi:site-specific recombinase XerD